MKLYSLQMWNLDTRSTLECHGIPLSQARELRRINRGGLSAIDNQAVHAMPVGQYIYNPFTQQWEFHPWLLSTSSTSI